MLHLSICIFYTGWVSCGWGGLGCDSVESIDLQPGTSMQTVIEDRSAGPFFAEPDRFEWCRCPADGMCNEYSLHR